MWWNSFKHHSLFCWKCDTFIYNLCDTFIYNLFVPLSDTFLAPSNLMFMLLLTKQTCTHTCMYTHVYMYIIAIYEYVCEHDFLTCTLYNESHYILYLTAWIEIIFLSCLLSLFPSKFTANTDRQGLIFSECLWKQIWTLEIKH